MNAREIPIELIDQPKSPLRGRIDAAGLEELADSIRAKGVLQPLLVKQVGDRFEVVAGHRRFLASTAAGLSCVPCVVLAAQEADAELATMLHENLFRTDSIRSRKPRSTPSCTISTTTRRKSRRPCIDRAA